MSVTCGVGEKLYVLTNNSLTVLDPNHIATLKLLEYAFTRTIRPRLCRIYTLLRPTGTSMLVIVWVLTFALVPVLDDANSAIT